MIFAEPFDQAYKAGINLKNIGTDNAIFFFKFKCCVLCRICEYTAGMMSPLAGSIVQKKNRIFRSSNIFIRVKCSVSNFGCCRC